MQNNVGLGPIYEQNPPNFSSRLIRVSVLVSTKFSEVSVSSRSSELTSRSCLGSRPMRSRAHPCPWRKHVYKTAVDSYCKRFCSGFSSS